MKLLAINGSPRKSMNTASLLEQVIKGAASTGADGLVTLQGMHH